MKVKTFYSCNACGYRSPKWVGKCPDCDAWNTFSEEQEIKNSAQREHQGIKQETVPLLNQSVDEKRYKTGIEEFDRVMGGGIVNGSVTLLSGEPGIGKSTLTLTLAQKIAEQTESVLYVSGEESTYQIGLRAKRMGVKAKNIHLLAENTLENILATIENLKPSFLIVDSIQVVHSASVASISGSITQVRMCAEALTNYAKKNQVPLVLIGHVTKEGTLAGPKILEHLVDTVLVLEGDRYQQFRVIRGIKNRFGSTNEIGLFEMNEDGLQEIANASEMFLDGRKENSFGSALCVIMEGTRPLILEIQALTNITNFGYPKRAASGFDVNRLQLLIAVIQKHLNLNLSNQDIFVNVVGGMKISDPSVDLAVVMAIVSSYLKKPLPEKTVYLGELGLSGEIRNIPHLNRRVQEAEKIGMSETITGVSKAKSVNKKMVHQKFNDLQSIYKTLKKVE